MKAGASFFLSFFSAHRLIVGRTKAQNDLFNEDLEGDTCGFIAVHFPPLFL